MNLQQPSKIIFHNKDHEDIVQKGLNLIYDTVSETYGPSGSNVLIERHLLPPIITKDGATVIDNIYVDNKLGPIVNLLKNITRKTAKDTGAI